MIQNSTEKITPVEIVENGSTIVVPSAPSNDHDPKNTNDEDMETSSEKPLSALEILAKDLESIGKYKDMNNEVKETDMIAFKVFTPSFEKSPYIIGLVESIIGRESPDQQDYDFALTIMGKLIWKEEKCLQMIGVFE